MKWYYAEDKTPVGPVSEQDIRALVGAGKITSDTLVWNRGFDGWQKFGKIKKSVTLLFLSM